MRDATQNGCMLGDGDFNFSLKTSTSDYRVLRYILGICGLKLLAVLSYRQCLLALKFLLFPQKSDSERYTPTIPTLPKVTHSRLNIFKYVFFRHN
jgi:hypothetical protein